jgi:hypothetical protein
VDIYDINRGLDLVRDGKAGRVMIRMAINAERQRQSDVVSGYQNNGSIEFPVLTSGI